MSGGTEYARRLVEVEAARERECAQKERAEKALRRILPLAERWADAEHPSHPMWDDIRFARSALAGTNKETPVAEAPKRNPERVIRAIRASLARWPSLRIGQLIANAYPDPFYVEDDDLAASLEAALSDPLPSTTSQRGSDDAR